MLSGAVGIRPSGARPPQEGSVGGGKNSELTFKPTQHDAPKAAKVAFSGRSGKKSHGFTGGAKLLKREAPWGTEQNCAVPAAPYVYFPPVSGKQERNLDA